MKNNQNVESTTYYTRSVFKKLSDFNIRKSSLEQFKGDFYF